PCGSIVRHCKKGRTGAGAVDGRHAVRIEGSKDPQMPEEVGELPCSARGHVENAYCQNESQARSVKDLTRSRWNGDKGWLQAGAACPCRDRQTAAPLPLVRGRSIPNLRSQ